MLIKVKNYEGYNRAMGKYIRSRKHYEEEMRKGGYIPFREASPKSMKWVPSADLKKTLGDFKQMADKKGKIKLGSRAIEKMEKMGVSFNPKFMPKGLKGGID